MSTDEALTAQTAPADPATPPKPLPDLDWDPDRAKAFADRAVTLWHELLTRLPDLPVAGRWRQEEVEAGVGRPVPEDPLPEDDLITYLREVLFDWSMYTGHPR